MDGVIIKDTLNVQQIIHLYIYAYIGGSLSDKEDMWTYQWMDEHMEQVMVYECICESKSIIIIIVILSEEYPDI